MFARLWIAPVVVLFVCVLRWMRAQFVYIVFCGGRWRAALDAPVCSLDIRL
jgi:hypothetical protein